MAYGIQMSTSGFAFWYPMVMSAVIYGGSLEFVAVNMLLSIAGGTIVYMILIRAVF